MAIAFDAASNGNDSTGTTLTFSHTCSGSNRVLVVFVDNFDGDHVTGITYNNVAMTQLTKVAGASLGEHYCFYLIAPTTGANNVVVTTSGSGDRLRAVSLSYTGVSQTGFPDASNTQTGTTSGSSTVSVTVVASNCWLLCGMLIQNYGSGFTPTNCVDRVHHDSPTAYSSGGAYVVGMDSNGTVSTGAQNIGMNGAGGQTNWKLIGVSIAPAPNTVFGRFSFPVQAVNRAATY